MIAEKSKCTGCLACVAVCPHGAITYFEDEEGFVYPHIKDNKCIHCNLCRNICPATNEQGISEFHYIGSDIKYYAGQLKDKDMLFEVSSGGAFWAFTKYVISKGGVVYGAVQEDVDRIIHKRAETIEEAERFRRSKYFQSTVFNCFNDVKIDLECGKYVLFSGTGCQIAALYAYLRKDCDNLYTCEVVCHGVPSMKVWRQYRVEKETTARKKISDLIFRDKSEGWSKNQYKITYGDGSVEYERSTHQIFHAGYLQGLFYRPSCGTCQFARLPRQGDITLADFWKYDGCLRTGQPDYGISLIVINSKKGNQLLCGSSEFLDLDETSERDALSSCKHLGEHPSENPNRKEFFNEFYQNGYHIAINKFLKTSNNNNIWKRIIRKLKLT